MPPTEAPTGGLDMARWPASKVEMWLPVIGHDGYEVSSLGRVRSLDRLVEKAMPNGTVYRSSSRGRVLKPFKSGDGYLAVGLGRGAKSYVHRLVCEAFHGASDLHVAHWNGDKEDNRSSNLRWATVKENASDKHRHGTYKSPPIFSGDAHPMAKLSRDQVQMIRDRYKRGMGASLAKQFGVSRSTVCRAARMETWHNVA